MSPRDWAAALAAALALLGALAGGAINQEERRALGTAAAIHLGINDARAELGLPRLEPKADLDVFAGLHSRDLMTFGLHGHEGSDGRGFPERFQDAALPCRAAAENVASAAGLWDPAIFVEGWLDSPGHRANIEGDWQYSGVGVAIRGREIRLTQVFCL